MSDEVIAEMRREIDALRARVFELEGVQRAAAEPVAQIEDARVSRRNLLGKAGAVAAAGVAGAVVGGGVLAQPAAANNGDDLLCGRDNTASNPTTLAIYNYEDDYGLGVFDVGGNTAQIPNSGYVSAYSRNRASGKNMPAFRGDAEASNAFYGTSKNVPAVFATSTGSAGVQGNCTGNGPAGVIGASTNTSGVWGLGQGGAGVLGQSTSGPGVRAESSSGDAVRAVGGSGRGIYATANGQPAVQATSTSSEGVFASSGSSFGLFAQSSTGNGASIYSAAKAGLISQGSTYGATFQGGTAALKIVPQSTAGKPTSGLHARGELLCDNTGVLWFCTAGGSPGTWKKVTLA